MKYIFSRIGPDDAAAVHKFFSFHNYQRHTVTLAPCLGYEPAQVFI